MISKNQISIYSSLGNKKYREIHRKFLAEGEKIVLDILNSPTRIFRIQSLIATLEFLETNAGTNFNEVPEILEVSPGQLKKISSLSTPNKAILVCELPEYIPDFSLISRGLSLFLEDIRDPGNLGTIVRTADWFGIHHIFCSTESVDIFNPKVVQSTMGAICRVKVYYIETQALIREAEKIGSYPLIGTLLEGENIYSCDLPSRGIIVLGNESKGISEYIKPALYYKLTIPREGDRLSGSESLNVATAAAIVMAEFSRKKSFYSK